MDFKVGDEVRLINLSEANVTACSRVGQRARVIQVNKESGRVKIEGEGRDKKGVKGIPFGYVYEHSIELIKDLKDKSEVI